VFGKKRREERRLPENAELRKRFGRDQKAKAEQDLSSAQSLTDANNGRIQRLRDVARVIGVRRGL
jgi:hypothetical protein